MNNHKTVVIFNINTLLVLYLTVVTLRQEINFLGDLATSLKQNLVTGNHDRNFSIVSEFTFGTDPLLDLGRNQICVI